MLMCKSKFDKVLFIVVLILLLIFFFVNMVISDELLMVIVIVSVGILFGFIFYMRSWGFSKKYFIDVFIEKDGDMLVFYYFYGV